MKVMLALHGFLGLPSDWNEVQKEFQLLQSEYKLVPVDYMNLRGLTPDVGLDRWGENFCLWAEKNYPRCERVLAGYSLGGRLALHALKAKPSVWSQALFLSTNPGLLTDAEKKNRRDTDLRWAQRFQTVDFASVVRDWNLQPVFEHSKNEPCREAKDYESENLARALVQWSLGRQENFLMAEALKLIPSHWFAGEYDQKFTALLNSLNDVRSEVLTKNTIGESSHRLIFEQPKEMAREFAKILASMPLKPSVSKMSKQI